MTADFLTGAFLTAVFFAGFLLALALLVGADFLVGVLRLVLDLSAAAVFALELRFVMSFPSAAQVS